MWKAALTDWANPPNSVLVLFICCILLLQNNSYNIVVQSFCYVIFFQAFVITFFAATLVGAGYHFLTTSGQ